MITTLPNRFPARATAKTNPVAVKIYAVPNKSGKWISFEVYVHNHSIDEAYRLAMEIAALKLGGAPEDHYPRYVCTRTTESFGGAP